MTRDETVKIVRIITVAYPNYKPNNLSEVVDLWQMMFSDNSYDEIAIALKGYIATDTSGFAPTVGQINKLLQSVKEEPAMTPLAAWAYVAKAISNSIYNSEKEFNKLPEIIKRAVGSPHNLREMAMMDIETVNSVEQAQFIKSYNAEVKRAEEYKSMPVEIKNLIQERINNGTLGISENI